MGYNCLPRNSDYINMLPPGPIQSAAVCALDNLVVDCTKSTISSRCPVFAHCVDGIPGCTSYGCWWVCFCWWFVPDSLRQSLPALFGRLLRNRDWAQASPPTHRQTLLDEVWVWESCPFNYSGTLWYLLASLWFFAVPPESWTLPSQDKRMATIILNLLLLVQKDIVASSIILFQKGW